MREYWLGWRLGAVLVLILVAAALQWPLWDREIAAAGGVLTYARNLAAGDGLVPHVGAERVEGFSDPAWVGAVASLCWLGLDPASATRWLGLLLGCAAVPAVFVSLRPLEKEHPLAPAWGAAAVALFAPHALWSQSGLENPLFSFLLALGCARLANGGDREWLGPLAFLGLAWTRPEGVLYAGVAATWAIGAAPTRRRAAIRAGVWAAAFAAPLLGSELLRLWYFGQAFPATVHARLDGPPIRSWDGASRGWVQLRGFAVDTGSVLVAPLLAVGALGAKEWRWVAGPIAIGVLALGWIFPSVPVLALFFGLPLLALQRKLPVVLAASLFSLALAFHVGSGGDGMPGYRWLSLVAVPGAMLVGVGIAELAERFELMRIGAPVTALFLAIPQVAFLVKIDRIPEDSPPDPLELERWTELGRKLHLDRRWRIVDPDPPLGGEIAAFRDPAGRVDLPFALYGTAPSVVSHELFEDRPFDFAKLEGSALEALEAIPAFRQGYVEIGSSGRYVRRSLLLEDGWEGSSAPIAFAGGIRILGFSIPSPEVASGSGLYLEVGLTGSGAPFRLVAFLSDDQRVVQSWDLPPAYDWVAPPEWRPGEVFHGKFSVGLPGGLPSGSYDLGFVVFSGDGAVLPALSAASPARVPHRPRLAEGEARLIGAVHLVGSDEMGRLALVDRAEALSHAGAGRCEEAERAWMQALGHRAGERAWRDANRPPVARALARCLSDRAGAGPTEGGALLDRVRELEQARLWDPREPRVWSSGASIADRAHERGESSEAPEQRFQWFEAAVRADPRRSWDRRLAEQARASWARTGR